MKRIKQTIPSVAILEAIARAGGTVSGDVLFVELRKSRDISFGEFLKLLMILELRGLVRVSSTSEERFFVHITERALKILTTREEPISD
ncbi:MAG: hypothetical protein RMI56_05390 [Sulfolobales archaeon]|nr:hypothetical protein [Sulfolobales archaeon]MDW8083214.1 hypothetical protein [Sulfolobales archaeon]